jgi:ribonucleoside-diphosphate reductase alpha chain
VTWRVIKINQSTESYDEEKVADAIFLAAQDVGGTDRQLAKQLAALVSTYLKRQFGRKKTISTRDVGDGVERILIENHHIKTAKAYILNRDKKREEFEAKIRLGVVDDVGLPLNSLVVMKNKYLQVRSKKKEERSLNKKYQAGEGEELETPGEAFRRVAKALAAVEKKEEGRKKIEEDFYQIMRDRKFLPGGRTLANAGTINNQLANCFVLPFPDRIEDIFEVVKESSILKKNGGGVGFTFKEIRPRGDLVSTTSGRACGPVALMSILNDASEIFVQAGGRRSGNMVTLPVSHPDIFEFISCKESGTNLPHINYSISVSDRFMKAVAADDDWDLVNPRTDQVVQTVRARSILEQAARLAWKNGDPGIIFIDHINKDNPTPHVGPLETVNLCGEQPLLAYEACNLGSVNISAHLMAKKGRQSTVGDYGIDWEALAKTVAVGVRMLDNVVSVCAYPLQKVDDVVKANRKIGLGVMGWADALVKLGIAYGSEESVKLATKVMKAITKTAWETSAALGREKGSFPNFAGSIWQQRGYKHFRNATTTTIAPTGSISMLAGCSYGIEPHFALAFFKKAMGDYELPELNQDLVVALKRANRVYSQELINQVAKIGSIQGFESIPAKLREVFVAAMDISPEAHVRMQAAFQRHTDNAVSKTINMSGNVSVEDVLDAYTLAWKLGCKGITVYRDRSRVEQVLNVGSSKPEIRNTKYEIRKGIETDKNKEYRIQNSEKEKDVCPECGERLSLVEGCASCESCGYSRCSV